MGCEVQEEGGTGAGCGVAVSGFLQGPGFGQAWHAAVGLL